MERETGISQIEMRAVSATKARNSIWILFFVMGILSMAWVPRIPEIKRSLGINNGQFGLVLLGSTVGAISGTQICGRLVHRYGSKTILRFVTLQMPLGVIFISLSTHSVVSIFFSLFFMAFGYVGIDVCVNTQAVAIEKHLNRRYMSSFHGLWSVGAFAATLFGGIVSHYISPQINLLSVGIAGAIINFVALQYVLSNRDDGHEGGDEATGKIPLFDKKYMSLWLIGIAFIGALLPEGAVSDWSAILLKENMGIAKGLNATGFGSFALAMIVARLFGDRVLAALGPVKTVRLGGYLGGIGMGLGIAIGVPLSHSHPLIALLIVNLGFIIAGLGIGPMVPAMMLGAAALPGIAPSVAMARVGIIGMGAFFIGPTITGGLAQWINLPVAMFFPVATLILAGWLSRSLKD
jgi:MFS family permease